MGSNKERAKKAIEAMKPLGISKKQVTPVLKRLLKLFDNNWEPIEDESYRALADAILDDQNNQPMPATSHHGTDEEPKPRSSTRHRPDDQHPSASASWYDMGDNDNETPLIKRPRMSSADCGHEQSLQPFATESMSLEPASPRPTRQQISALTVVQQAADQGDHSGIITCKRDKTLLLENPQDALFLKEPKPEPEIDVPAAPVAKHLYIGSSELGAVHSEDQSYGGNLQKEAVDTNALFVKAIACKDAVDWNGNVAPGSSLPEFSEPSYQNWIVACQPELALSKQRPIHDVADISKGVERVRISIVNEFGNESCPPSFFYIGENHVFQNAYLNISIARIGDDDCCADCSGNCLSASLPCACARSTGGEFAYTSEGLVRTPFLDECIAVNNFPQKHNKFYCKACPLERSKNQASPDPCKGHLARKFIKECWRKCGCGMQCGNRVIQRGITCNLQVFFTSDGKGWGLRTLDELPKGAFICEYVGEVLTSIELHERTVQNSKNAKHVHQVLLDANWGSKGVLRDEEALCLDATFYGNVGRFVNHRCYDANLVLIPAEVETPDRHYYHLAFFTAKKVEAIEELTWDYGIDFDGKAFRCMCGSKYCRDPKNSRKRTRAATRQN